MTYAEMIALPDNMEVDSDLGNNEDESSAITTPTPASRVRTIQSTPITPVTTHSITVNYRHCYSLERKNGEQIDISTLLQSLTDHTSLQLPSASLIATSIEASDFESSENTKQRVLSIEGMKKPLVFTALDISDPPHLQYSNHMDQLIHDWEDSNHLVIKGVSVPLKYWSQVFRWARPKAWEVLKDIWSKWRVRSPPRYFRAPPFPLQYLLSIFWNSILTYLIL